MIFQRKYDRARQLQKERMEGQELLAEQEDPENVLEKHDTSAMVISALLVFIPAALLVLGAICLVGYVFVVR